MLGRFPTAPVDPDNIGYYRGLLQRRLMLNRCRNCRRWHHPPVPICPHCWSSRVVPTEVSGSGQVFLTTTLHLGPPAAGVDYSSGYTIVTVELAEQDGLRVTAPIVNCCIEVHLGMPVSLTWIERDGAPVPAFAPAPG